MYLTATGGVVGADNHSSHAHTDEEVKPGSALLKAIPEESSCARTATYGCPVCRKAHLLDLDRLQVHSATLEIAIALIHKTPGYLNLLVYCFQIT